MYTESAECMLNLFAPITWRRMCVYIFICIYIYTYIYIYIDTSISRICIYRYGSVGTRSRTSRKHEPMRSSFTEPSVCLTWTSRRIVCLNLWLICVSQSCTCVGIQIDSHMPRPLPQYIYCPCPRGPQLGAWSILGRNNAFGARD